MKVTIELIDELRSRVNVTYDEAKKTLEKNDGDLIKSIIELEEKKGAKAAGTVNTTNKDGFAEFVDKVLQLRFSVKSKEGEVLINVPLVLVALTFLMAFWVVIIGLAIAIVYSCNIKIYKAKKFSNVHDIKANIKQTVNKVKSSTEKMFDNDDEVNLTKNDNKNDDNEIIIE